VGNMIKDNLDIRVAKLVRQWLTNDRAKKCDGMSSIKSSFIDKILEAEPFVHKIPHLELFNGLSYPSNHLNSYKSVMSLYRFHDPIL